MRLLDSITVAHQGVPRQIQLFVGDLTAIPAGEAVDALVVSAFPDDYVPTSGSLIGALYRAGVSVAALARNPEVDLRQFSCCWLSRPVPTASANFRRILCFEPQTRGRAPEMVGDVFRSLIPFTTANPPISRIALPVLASGDMGEPAEVMLRALVQAAAQWLSVGVPLDQIKIVLRETPGRRR